MEDQEIIALYYKRDERAITETNRKYGGFCRRIAQNLLHVREDAEECVNDTYHAAWNRMPPELPHSLCAYLGRIVRNLSISRFRANHAQKRFAGVELLFSELEECIPDSMQIEELVAHRLLSEQINSYLASLPQVDAALFVRRYWYGDSIGTLAAEAGCKPQQMTQRMLRLRRKLRQYLETEGVSL